MKRLIRKSEEININTLDDEEIDYIPTEEEFYKLVGYKADIVSDYFHYYESHKYGEDPYQLYLEYKEYGEQPKEFVNKIEEAFWTKSAEEEQKYYEENIDNLNKQITKLKDLVNNGEYEEFWNIWEYGFTDYYKDVNGRRPSLNELFPKDVVDELLECCPY